MVSLNSRERVIKALNHQEPDQTPIDFGGTASSGISIIAYNKLKKFLSLPGENTKLYDLMQQIADPEYDVLDQMGADVVQLYRYAPRYNIKVEKWKPWVLKDGSQCRVPEEYNPILNKSGDEEIIENNTVIAKMPREGFYYDIVNYPLKNAESIEDIDKAMRLGFNHPVGPFQLVDMSGVDVVYHSLEGLTKIHGDRFKPTQKIKDLVDRGNLGQKTGQGFYEYSPK